MQSSTLDAKNSLRNHKTEFGYLTPPHSQVDWVRVRRRESLWAAGINDIAPAEDLRQGRLLAYDGDTSLDDGYASHMTSGFFDDHNIPPLDTWVAYVYEPPYAIRLLDGPPVEFDSYYSYLVAWIPPSFIELAQIGINVNPEGCIEWLDNLETPFVRTLREWRLLL